MANGNPEPRPDPRIGGYAMRNLSPDEERQLLEAALQDQKLFDELAAEFEMRELLDQPGVRQAVAADLAPKPSSWSLLLASLSKPKVWAPAGVLAAGAVMMVVLSPSMRVEKQTTVASLPVEQESRREDAAVARVEESRKPVAAKRAVQRVVAPAAPSAAATAPPPVAVAERKEAENSAFAPGAPPVLSDEIAKSTASAAAPIQFRLEARDAGGNFAPLTREPQPADVLRVRIVAVQAGTASLRVRSAGGGDRIVGRIRLAPNTAAFFPPDSQPLTGTDDSLVLGFAPEEEAKAERDRESMVRQSLRARPAGGIQVVIPIRQNR